MSTKIKTSSCNYCNRPCEKSIKKFGTETVLLCAQAKCYEMYKVVALNDYEQFKTCLA